MVPQKFQIRAKLTSGLSNHGLVKMLHRWIREESVPGILIDVADYAHVPDGPGILLIGYEVDYGFEGDSIDSRELVVSWRTKRKGVGGTFGEVFAEAWAATQTAIEQIGVAGELDVEKLGVGQYQVAILDRLVVPRGEDVPTEIVEVVAKVSGSDVVVVSLEDERFPAALVLA